MKVNLKNCKATKILIWRNIPKQLRIKPLVNVLSILILSIWIISCSSSDNNKKSSQEATIETDSVTVALENFPASITSEFATNYPEVEASEIFKRVEFVTNPDGVTFYGIEGLSADETLEIDAVYTENAIFVKSGRGEILETLPPAIATAFESRYPNGAIEEMASSTEDGEVSYAVLFVQNSDELEANFDADGVFESLENVLEENEIPSTIIDVVEAQNVDMPEVEYEEVTHADGSVSYVVEFENDSGESISYKISLEGVIQQIDWEGPITDNN